MCTQWQQHEALIEVPQCAEAEHNQEAERQTEQLNGQPRQGSWGKTDFSINNGFQSEILFYLFIYFFVVAEDILDTDTLFFEYMKRQIEGRGTNKMGGGLMQNRHMI